MALIAWYPLNGDTKDYSGNNNHIVNSATTTATINSSGKIGSCYKMDGTIPSMLKTPITSSLFKSHTISFWIYNSQTSTRCVMGNRGNNTDTETTTSTQRTHNYYLYPTRNDFH